MPHEAMAALKHALELSAGLVRSMEQRINDIKHGSWRRNGVNDGNRWHLGNKPVVDNQA